MKNNKTFNLFKVMFSKKFLAVMSGMFVFGLMDNGIMVLAGSAIDEWIQSFGFSTMFSAGLGNTFSDAIGVVSGSLVAKFVHDHLGEVDAKDIGKTLFTIGEVVGIVLGCLFGLIPLAFIG